MQGKQDFTSDANIKNESVWFKTKLISQFLTLSFLLTQPFYLSYLHAAPVGGNVVGGTGSISQSDLTTTINQTSQNLAVNWQSFDVNTNEKVNFVQPNSSSIALNRILGNNGSTIQGQINANGQVILVNPNGIFFTSTATINVGGLIASSLDMTPSDFMNGNYIFNEVLGTTGAVVNSGVINASLGGNVALIGKQVKNDGLIAAKLGSVVMAAGKQSVLTFDNRGLIGVKVTKEVLQEELGLEEAVINNGEIKAAGGRVLLTASTSQDIFSQAVNTYSLDQATSVVVNADGTFTLGGGADVLNTGSIDVSSEFSSQNTTTDNTARIILLGENVTSSGTIKADVQNGKAGEIEIHAKNKTLLTENSITSAKALNSGTGGVVKVLGDKVGVFDQSEINVSGFNGGGQALIGGDYRGQNSRIRNATSTYVGVNSVITADATTLGNAGRVIVWGNELARVYGSINARGGLNGGDGGFVETSAKVVDLDPLIDVSAVNGLGGTWLIDPDNIVIRTGSSSGIDTSVTDTFSSTSNNSRLNIGALKSALEKKSVTVIVQTSDSAQAEGTGGNITIRDEIDLDSTELDSYSISERPTLELRAHHDIIINASLHDSSGGNDAFNLELYADTNKIDGGAIEFNALVETNGGYIIADTFDGNIDFTNVVNTDGGAITATTVNGAVNITNEIYTNGGDFEAKGNNVTIDYQNNRTAIDTQGGSLKLIAASAGLVKITDSNLSTGGGLFEVQGGGFTSTATTTNRRVRTGGGNVNLFVDGAINIGQNIITTGGNFTVGDTNNTIIPTSFTNSASINTTGSNDVAGGAINVTTSGIINVTATGELKADGGDASNNRLGQDGGNITLAAGDEITIASTNAISSVGSNGKGNGGFDGGKGGSVDIKTSLNNVVITSTITTNGGNGDGDNNNSGAGGNSGSILIEATNGTVEVGQLISNGGNAKDDGNNSPPAKKGGNSSEIRLTSGAGQLITLNNDISASAGSGRLNTDTAGSVNINGETLVNTPSLSITAIGSTNGDVSFNGNVTVAATRDRADDLSVTGKDITFAGNVGSLSNRFKDIVIISDGAVKAETGPTVAERTDFFVDTLNVDQSSTFSARHINAIAVDDTSTSRIGTTNNTVNINASNSIDVGNISTTAGGNAAGAGHTGGGILLTAQDITVGTLNSAGSDAGVIDVNGGNAGVIALTATDNASNGTPSITLNGDLNSEGGAAVGGTGIAGTSENVKLSINSTELDAVGTVTVGAFTGNFSSAVDVAGSNGIDTLVASDRINSWVLTGATTATLNSKLTFTDFEEITGSSALNSDTLTARSVNNTWLVNGAGSGSVTNTDNSNESMVFRNINGLVGNAGVDNFTLTSTGSLTGSTDGVSNTNNSLTIETGFDNVWTINSENAGAVSLTTKLGNGFTNIQKIKGGDGDDTFNFGINGSVDLVEGGTDNSNAPSPTQGDIVNFISKTAGVDITLGTTLTASTTDFNIDSVEQINANATAAKNTLTAKDQENTWNLTEADGGTLDSGTDNTVDFNNFTDLNGALNFDDQFIIGDNGSLTGQLDGRGQNTLTGDQLDLSLRADIVLNIDNTIGNSLSYTGGSVNYADIETIVGNGTTSTVTGDDIDTTWSITGTNSGSVKQTAIGGTRTTFSGFNNLTGGTGIDRFDFDAAGDITGFVDGGTAITNDFVSMTTATALSKAFSLSSTLNSNATNLINIENVQGDSTTTGFVELIGPDTTGTNTWTITGIDRGAVLNSVDGKNVTFTDVVNITGGNGDDNFDFAGAATSIQITGLIDGGNGGTDIVDMSGLTGSISVDIGNDITRIDSVVGNNNATLIGADFTSNWNIRGINSGDIVYNNGMSNLLVGFSQFNNLQGKNGINDSFKFFVGGDIAGVIKGGSAGGANSIDTADYSLIQNKTIIVGDALQGITEIEQVTGDNSTTVLRGISSFSNTWLLDGAVGDGLNDGEVSFTDASNVVHDLLFLNISKLEAGASNDNFTIRDGASLNGSIKGGIGNDQISIQLTGTQSGLLAFDGSLGGANTLNITGDSDNGGGGTDYSGVYTSDIDSLKSDKFVYTNSANGSQYSIQYANTATINDDLFADSLTVNGTQYNDTITLDSSSFQVSHVAVVFPVVAENDATTVNYTNKTNLVVDGLAGNGDEIKIISPLDFGATGTLELKAETLTLPDTTSYTGALITAAALKLDSINTIASAINLQPNTIQTNIDSLSVVNSGTVVVNEVDSIDIAVLSTTNLVDITNASGDITSTSVLVSNNSLNLTATAGDISLTGANELTGQLSFNTSSTNDIVLNNTTVTRLNNVSSRNLSVTSNGSAANIIQSSGTVTSTGLATLNSSGDITLTNAANNFNQVAGISLQDFNIRDTDSIALNAISGNTVKIVSGASISDSNDTGVQVNNITANTVTLSAVTGVGNGNAIETITSNLDVTSTSGPININNSGDLKSTTLITDGNISLLNQGNVEITKIDVGYGTRSPLAGNTLTMTVLAGSVTAKTSPAAAYKAIPDITAFNADIIVAGGTFGTSGRPISVRVNNEFNLFSLQSAVYYIGEPLKPNDTSTAKISITDAFSSLAGQQLIEIESIGDVDPAIFTDVRNYNHSDLALMMPSDQRYNVSDEEDDDEAKAKRNKLINSKNQK